MPDFNANLGKVTLTDLASGFSSTSGELKGKTLDDGSVKIYQGSTGLKTHVGLKTPDPEKQRLAKQVLYSGIENQYGHDMAERLFNDFHIAKASTKVSGELIHQLEERAIGLSQPFGMTEIEDVSMRDVIESTGMQLFDKLSSYRDIKQGDLCITVFPMSTEYGLGHVSFYDSSKLGGDRWQDKGSTPERNENVKSGATFVRICDDKLATRVRGMLDVRRSAMPFMKTTDMIKSGAGPFVKTFSSGHTQLKSERAKVLEHALVDLSYLKAHQWAQQQITTLDQQLQPTRNMDSLRGELFSEMIDIGHALKNSPDQDTLLHLDDRLDDAFDRLPGSPYAERPDTSEIDSNDSLSLNDKVQQKKKLLEGKISEMLKQIQSEENTQRPIREQIQKLETFSEKLTRSDSWKTLHPDEPGVYCSSFATRMLQSAQLSLEIEAHFGKDPEDSPLAALAQTVSSNVDSLTRRMQEQLGLKEPEDGSEDTTPSSQVKSLVTSSVDSFMESDEVEDLFEQLPKGMDITPRASPHTLGKGTDHLTGDEVFKSRPRSNDIDSTTTD